ncbi:cytochrome P450 [Amylostereum chailletii]|nr:cytochrome P450 [Amylostereum chailletii]
MSLSVLDVVALASLLLLVHKRRSSQATPRPPGPRGWPIIGNLLDMPQHESWKTFAELGERYGRMVYLNVLGQPFIIVNSYRVAVELLEKKSHIYSDRPVLVMGGELSGWKKTLALTPYGSQFRAKRRMLHQFMGTRASVQQYADVEEHETRRFLQRVLNDPDATDLQGHTRWLAGAIILKLAFGYQIQDQDDPFVLRADSAVAQFSLTSEAGAFLVDIAPWLVHLPSWFPGAGWKRMAKEYAQNLEAMAQGPLDYVTAQRAGGGTALPVSFASSYLERDLTAEDSDNFKWAAASLYSGGADTTVSAMYAFFLAMTLYPDVQRKAQAEIDAVLYSDSSRLPGLQDRDDLPYIDALTKEVLRWNSVAPVAIPHRLIQDDNHDGYFFPKGSIIIANVWNMLRNEDTYHNALVFNPDRFLGEHPEQDPRDICFGFGRRICPGTPFPGMNLADASLFVACAMSLATLNISKAIENGVVIEPERGLVGGTIAHPKEFRCRIEPRSEKAVAMVRAA